MSDFPQAHTGRVHRPVSSEGFSLRKLRGMLTRNWFFLAVCLVVALALAFLYNRYAPSTYMATASLLIEQESPGPSTVDLLQGFDVRQGAQNLDNQVQILNSYKTIRQALEELSFEVDCSRRKLFSEVSYYPVHPLRIVPAWDSRLPYGSRFIFRYMDQGWFRIYTPFRSHMELDTIAAFGDVIHTPEGSFIIHPQEDLTRAYASGEKIHISFTSTESLTERYRNKLVIETASRDGSIVNLSVPGTNRTRNVVFLEELCKVFIYNNLEKKNQEASRIIEFIEEQLVNVTDSLNVTENQLQEFRSKNRIMDVSAQAQKIIDQAVVLENENARLTLERNYFVYLENYLEEDDNDQAAIAPATMGIVDPLLTTLMQELAALQSEYFSNQVGAQNPLQANLELRIRNAKRSILETLGGIMLANEMAITENKQQIEQLNYQASKLPVDERKLLGIERRFNLNNVLYTFLLQRRAEAQIQKASNQPDNEIVDHARASSVPVAPDPFKIYAIALFLGLGIPFLLLLLVSKSRNVIYSEEDLKQLTDFSVIGHVPQGRFASNKVVLSETDSPASEAFRNLRARMEFHMQRIKCPVILFTSSIMGEGKTFAALNLASACSLTGKRTLLVGFDLRRPSLAGNFEVETIRGFTSYLIGQESLHDVIHPTGYKNLDILPAGPIPPNPGELASPDRFREMLDMLRQDYEFIIVDSAPLGSVSDSYAIIAAVDMTVMMVRPGLSHRKALADTLKVLKESAGGKQFILINGIKTSNRDYRYKYKYTSEKQKERPGKRKRKSGSDSEFILI